jgi:hypothetical protein
MSMLNTDFVFSMSLLAADYFKTSLAALLELGPDILMSFIIPAWIKHSL